MSRTIGLTLIIIGLVTGIVIPYALATMDRETLIEVFRWTTIVLMILIGGVLTATGYIIIKDTNKRYGENK